MKKTENQDSNQYWEVKFKEIRTEWGFEPADSAILAKDIFMENKAKEILIPGIGYGRNAKIFLENGMNVTGIEISQTAIDLAKQENELQIDIHQGSVTEMPFDDKMYDGIFCYSLLHLFDYHERKQILQNCYNQLKTNGIMLFTIVSKKTSIYGEGKLLSEDRFELSEGLEVFFYDVESAKKEFQDFGLVDCFELDEPIKYIKNEPPLKCIFMKCRKCD